MTLVQRSKEEVISLILQSAKMGATQTILMYETYLSHDALKEYLSLLLEQGFLENVAGEMKFKTTSVGLEYLLSRSGPSNSHCGHQCKKCGVLYYCEETMKCLNPFYHGICQGCVKVFSYEHTSDQINVLRGRLVL